LNRTGHPGAQDIEKLSSPVEVAAVDGILDREPESPIRVIDG
jgi:hypothetical protein